VRVRHIVAVFLPGVHNFLKRQGISGEEFLQQGIPNIFFVGQNVPDACVVPVEFTVLARDAVFRQAVGDDIHAFSSEIACKDISDDRGFLFIRNQNVVDQPVSEGGIAGDEVAALHPAKIAPAHVVGDGGGFLLCDGAEHFHDQLVLHFGGLDAFLFKIYVHAERFQFPESGEAVPDVSGKSGNGFDQNQIDFPFAAVVHHPQKILPLVRSGSGNALVGINIDQLPFIVAGDMLGVVIHLRGEGI